MLTAVTTNLNQETPELPTKITLMAHKPSFYMYEFNMESLMQSIMKNLQVKYTFCTTSGRKPVYSPSALSLCVTRNLLSSCKAKYFDF